jgi:hypothetical protein
MVWQKIAQWKILITKNERLHDDDELHVIVGHTTEQPQNNHSTKKKHKKVLKCDDASYVQFGLFHPI